MFKDRTRNLFYYDSVLTAVWLASIVWMLTTVDQVGSSEIWLSAALLVMVAVSSNLEFSVSRGKHTIEYSPDAQPMALAAIMLPPVPAMVVCAATLCDRYYFSNSVPWYKRTGLAGSVAIGVAAASAVVHLWVPDHLSPQMLLPTALVAAFIYEMVSSLLQAVMYEIKARGAGRQLLRDASNTIILSWVLAAVSVVVIMPFVDNIPLLVAAFLLFQIATYTLTRLAASEALLRERSEYLRNAFARYVPSHVAEQLTESGVHAALGGEQREITVLFVDIRGFTTWAEHERPETVITQLNEILGELSAAVLDSDGTLDKFIGDGLLAFWGAPLEQPDHAARAWHAGTSMLGRMDLINERRASRGLPPFRIGIGLHTGMAIVGNVGHERRLDYTAVGDTVNTASRLESATKHLEVEMLLSSSTRNQLPSELQALTTSMGSIELPGRMQSVGVYRHEDAIAGGRADIAA
jgi:class 3 adenylate cyclase